ncbi:arginine--tRNA ligase [endosymbiont 'TC1' of Trimyema compressum]|uniref:arginine--tRNA ligase n=1 Tax=endosymbiont 'TC1' of Trimyema compressum TaxID=243899 RepID=UPI0007F053A1|nr:arginine--tRNA ligase [endosymbiont 'TC1' of Trimyema compressum]AMP19801.1 arginine--tRNA ligase [endosymbiont 'TC1' of Trimyema compressum]
MGVIVAIEDKIKNAFKESALKAKEEGALSFEELPSFMLEVPKDKAHGQYAVNLAMVLTKIERKNPRVNGEILINHFNPEGTYVEKLELAGPGFINMHLNKEYYELIIENILAEKEAYGQSDFGQGEKINVEFVSANPTGLLHMGNARGAAIGDTLGNILKAVGYKVTKEYYINDAGNQIENFGKSLEARYLELIGETVEFPEDGYHGEDIITTVEGYIKKEGKNLLDVDSEKRRKILVAYGLEEKLGQIKEGLKRFGVTYDVWFSEKSLYESKAVDEALEILREKGYIEEKDGAIWLKATLLGEDKDEVMIRQNGTPTYFAADIAYHKNKFDRGFVNTIDVWGADHHGHVARMKKAMDAIGYDGSKLEVILMQLVRLFKGGETLRMSKRTGTYVTLEELLNEVGEDAARYFFVMRNPDSHLDFDLNLAKKESSDNPVFYIQYAYARISSILRQLEEPLEPYLDKEGFAYTTDAEEELIEKIGELEKVLIDAAIKREPYRIASYAYDLSGLFHQFYNACRVLNEEEPLKSSRLKLIVGTQYTLKNVLKILGVNAPGKM